MEDIATSVVTDCVKTGIHEVQYLCCFNNIVDDFGKKKEDLVASEGTVKKKIQEAKDRNEDITPDVKQWLTKANTLIGEDTTKKKNCFYGWFPNCIWRYRQGKSLDRKKQQVLELINPKFSTFSLPSKIPDIERLSSEDFVHFESRDQKYNQLRKELEDGNHHMIGLYGMPGSGKTTLAIEVGKNVKELKLFDYVLMVVVSNVPNVVRRIQDQIASYLNLKWDNENELDRANKLWKRLTSEDKILIILDDVWNWEEIKFKEIGIPVLDSKYKSCYVLLTSRNLEVCNKLGCQTIIKLEVLFEEEAWTLFRRYAKLNQSSSKTMEKKGQQIAKLCKGLPLAIVAIASILKNEEEEEWDAALRSLNRSVHNMEKNLERVYNPLEVSYNYLQSEAKELFKLCSVFPEDYKIFMEDITTFGIGLGLCGEVNSYGDGRYIVRKSLKKLINSCLLSRVNNEEFVKMHDLVRDAAHCIAKKAIHVVMDPESLKALQEDASVKSTLKHLFCHITNDLPKQLDCPKIELLILEWGHWYGLVTIPATFFEGMRGLKVCALNGIFKSWALLLPKSFESLNNLTTLSLRNFKLDDLFLLEKLESLQSLELKSCVINELPNGVVKLERLQLLRLTYCNIDKNPFGVITKLSQLEELYFMGNDLSCSQVSIEDVAIPSLQRYHIELTPGALLEESINDSISRALSIASFDGSPSDATIKSLVQRAEVLHMHELQGDWTTITPDFVGAIGEMNDLIDLKLKSCSKIMFLIDGTKLALPQETLFSNMTTLSLEDMDKLEELCHNLPLSDIFERLRELVIRQCPQLNSRLFPGKLKLCELKILCIEECLKLTSLFSLSTARSLDLLEELEIKECKALEYIIREESDEGKGKEIVEDDDNQMRSSSTFSGLKKLKILHVRNCPKLTSLFTLSIARSLVLLEELQINECESLKCIIKGDIDEGKVKEITEDVDGRRRDSPFFQKLKRLVIGSCHQSEHILSIDSNIKKGKEIVEEEDDKMRSFSLFPELKEMIIDSCHQLEQILFVGSNKSWKKRQLLEHTPPMDLQEVNSQQTRPFDATHWLLSQSMSLRHIKKMMLVKCELKISLFDLSIVRIMLLEELTIKGCHGLKHVITDERDGESQMNYCSILPKLKLLNVEDCSQLIYVIGEYRHLLVLDVFPALEELHLIDMPNIKSICPNIDQLKWSALRKLDLIECPQFSITSISDSKDFEENMKQAYNLNVLRVINCKIKGIICLEGNSVFGQLGIKDLYLHNLGDLSYTFSGPKHTLSLANLRILEIEGCGKLKFIFSTTVLRSLPKLMVLGIVNCEALEQIVEEDYENQNLSNPHNFQEVYFPNLRSFYVINCRKLKHLFWMNSPLEFPKLLRLFIVEASNLEEVFGSSEKGETEKQVENVLPDLGCVILLELPSLANFCQWTRLQNVREILVLNCPKLSLTSTVTLQQIIEEYQQLVWIRSGGESRYGIRWSYDIALKELNRLKIQEGPESETEGTSERGLHSSQSTTKTEENIVGEVCAPEIPPPATSSSTTHLGETTLEGQPQATGETKELMDKESRNETRVETNQEAFGKTQPDMTSNESQNSINTSAEEVTKSKKEISLTSMIPDLISRVSASGPQDLVEEGLNEPGSTEALEKSKITNGTPLLLDQNSDLAQKPSLESIKASVQEDSKPQKPQILTSDIHDTGSENLTPDFSVTSLHETSQQRLAKGGLDGEELSVETLGEIKGANETSQKPLDLVEKTSKEVLVTHEIGTYNDEGSKESSLSLEDLKDDIITLLNSMEGYDGNVQKPKTSASEIPIEHLNLENRQVAKAFADLEAYLKMPLKDIANSEFSSHSLEKALKSLSSWSRGNGAPLEALKSTIDSLLQDLPSILASFKQASSTIREFELLNEKDKFFQEQLPRQKEAAVTLISEISATKKCIAKAQQKEASLKEQICSLQAELKRIENEIQGHDARLSSLNEQRNKLHDDTIDFKKGFENIKKNKIEMAEDQRKAQQELFNVNHKWMAFSNQLEQNFKAARDLF